MIKYLNKPTLTNLTESHLKPNNINPTKIHLNPVITQTNLNKFIVETKAFNLQKVNMIITVKIKSEYWRSTTKETLIEKKKPKTKVESQTDQKVGIW